MDDKTDDTIDDKISEEDNVKIINTFEEFKSREFTDEDVDKVFDNEEEISKKAKKGPLAKYKEYISLFFSLLKDFSSKEYTDVSKVSIGVIIGALLYVFSPIDIIPDFIPIIGLIDDGIMIALAISFTKKEIEKYKEWKKRPSRIISFEGYTEET